MPFVHLVRQESADSRHAQVGDADFHDPVSIRLPGDAVPAQTINRKVRVPPVRRRLRRTASSPEMVACCIQRAARHSGSQQVIYGACGRPLPASSSAQVGGWPGGGVQLQVPPEVVPSRQVAAPPETRVRTPEEPPPEGCLDSGAVPARFAEDRTGRGGRKPPGIISDACATGVFAVHFWIQPRQDVEIHGIHDDRARFRREVVGEVCASADAAGHGTSPMARIGNSILPYRARIKPGFRFNEADCHSRL